MIEKPTLLKVCYLSVLCMALVPLLSSTTANETRTLPSKGATKTAPALVNAESSKSRPSAIRVGPNVQVSVARSDIDHYEVVVAADPINPNRLLACAIMERLPEFSGAYLSTDGGQHWRAVVTTDSDIIRGDPDVAFGLNKKAYFIQMSNYPHDDNKRGPLRPGSFYSHDGGTTWTQGFVPMESGTTIDRPWVVVDNGANSPYKGRVYLYGQVWRQGMDDTHLGPVLLTLWRSRDHGVTYDPPTQRSLLIRNLRGSNAYARSNQLLPGESVVLSDGTFVATVWFHEGPEPSPLYVVTSHDGGASLDVPVKVFDAKPPYLANLSVDASNGFFNDRLYVVWADSQFGRPAQIVLSYSADKGKTWSHPRIINDDRSPVKDGDLERNPMFAIVAVNNAGVVGVSWYDRRNNQSDEFGYEVRFAASYDGGETFTPSVLVSEKPHTFGGGEAWIPILRDLYSRWNNTKRATIKVHRVNWVGDTGGLAADASGRFHPVWIDNRTGVNQMWTATVSVPGRAMNNGSPDLAHLTDVSSQVQLVRTGVTYERKTQELQITVHLKNMSARPIVGPLKLRAISLSGVVMPTALNADNGISGEGAVWDFTPAGSKGTLVPGAKTREKLLRFRLTGADAADLRSAGSAFELFKFDGKILGRAPENRD